MTATLAAILVERGKIRWESTPAMLWPSEASAMHPVTRGVTLAQLISNSAGLEAFTSSESWIAANVFRGDPRQQRAQFVRTLLARPPAGEPGKYLYSNAGFALAGAMLEQASGQSWEELLRRELFEPLAMASCITDHQPSQIAPVPHRQSGQKFAPNPPTAEQLLPQVLAPAGGVYCSAPDLARFGEAHLLGLLGRHPLLRPASFQQLHTAMPGQTYGLGWEIDDGVSIHRGGIADRWHSVVIVSPKHRIVVVTSVNARALPVTIDLMTALIQSAFDRFATSPER
jgi:CubicO group peptidase (beta-lactamase class C family)